MRKSDNSEKDAVPVRVLHLIDRLTGYGTGRLLWDIVRLTPSDKVKHFVITFSPDKGKWVYADRLREKGMYYQFPKGENLQSRNKANGVLVKSQRPLNEHTLGERMRFLVRFSWVLWRVFKAMIWFRPDIIHVHTSHSLTVGVFLKLMIRRPMVHLVPRLFSQMVEARRAWVPGFYARYHRFIDIFFTGAARSREELLSVGIPVSKIFPLRGIIDLQEINGVRCERKQHHKTIRETLCLPSDALIALSVGRLHPSKGHLFALEVLPALVQQFPRLHWLLVGEGAQRVEIEARAKALGIIDHVHLLGYQDSPLPFYAAATVFLRTMILEATNLSTYQAMAMGLPLVAFDTGCEDEVIKRVGHGILVPNQSVDALSAAVAQVLTLPDQGREMGSRGIEYSRVNLDIRNAMADYTTIYHNLKNGFKVRSEQFLSN